MNAADRAIGWRSAHREVVDGAVDGEVADAPAREEQRADHVGVGGEREPGAPSGISSGRSRAAPRRPQGRRPAGTGARSAPPTAGRHRRGRCTIRSWSRSGSGQDHPPRSIGSATAPRRHAPGRRGSISGIETPVLVVGRARPLARRPSSRRAGPGCALAVPNAAHSSGLISPWRTSPLRQTGQTPRASIAPTSNRARRRSLGSRSRSRHPLRRDRTDAAPRAGRRPRTPRPAPPERPTLPSARHDPRRTRSPPRPDRPPAAATTRRIPSSTSSGSKPVTTIGTPVGVDQRPVLRVPMTSTRGRRRGSRRPAFVRGEQDRLDRRRDEHVAHEHREVRQAPRSRAWTTAMAFAGAVVSKPIAKNTTSRSGCSSAMATGVERRVDDTHVAALALHPEQVTLAAGHPQHVAERTEDHLGAGGDVEGPVDDLQRGDAHRAPGPVDELDGVGQELVDAVADDRVGLAAAHLHDRPGSCGVRGDLVEQGRASPGRANSSRYFTSRRLRGLRRAAGRRPARRRVTPISANIASVSRADASSTRVMAKPTWTMA